jgi:beta-fructofuranosidase
LCLELHLPGNILAQSTTTVRLLGDGAAAWELVIDTDKKEVRTGDKQFPLPGLPWPQPTLRLFLDGSVIESFIGGRECLTSRVYTLRPNATELEITTTATKPTHAELWPLSPISSDRLTT